MSMTAGIGLGTLIGALGVLAFISGRSRTIRLLATAAGAALIVVGFIVTDRLQSTGLNDGKHPESAFNLGMLLAVPLVAGIRTAVIRRRGRTRPPASASG